MGHWAIAHPSPQGPASPRDDGHRLRPLAAMMLPEHPGNCRAMPEHQLRPTIVGSAAALSSPGQSASPGPAMAAELDPSSPPQAGAAHPQPAWRHRAPAPAAALVAAMHALKLFRLFIPASWRFETDPLTAARVVSRVSPICRRLEPDDRQHLRPDGGAVALDARTRSTGPPTSGGGRRLRPTGTAVAWPGGYVDGRWSFASGIPPRTGTPAAS